MALKAILDSVDGLDEGLAALYVERDGKYYLDVEPAGTVALEDVGGLKSALGKEREAAEALRRRLKQYEGLDPERARAALEKAEQRAEKKPSEAADAALAEAKARLEAAEKKHQAEVQKIREEIAHRDRQIEKMLIDSAATSALAKHKGNVELLLPHIRAAAKVERTEAGEYVVKLRDENGNIRITNKAGTADMSIEEFAGSVLKERFPGAYEGTGMSGSGARGTDGTVGPGGVIRITEEEAADPAKYRRAKAAAQKAGVDLVMAD